MATKLDGDFRTPANRNGLLEVFVAELTLSAYRVALRTGTQGTWLDLELLTAAQRWSSILYLQSSQRREGIASISTTTFYPNVFVPPRIQNRPDSLASVFGRISTARY